MNLPGEIRLIVYGYLFEGSVLSASGPGIAPVTGWMWSSVEETCASLRCNVDHFYNSGALPGILTVSKALRQEAMPVFAISTLFDVTGYGTERRRHMPVAYLANVTSACIYYNDTEIDLPSLPNLHTLRVVVGMFDLPTCSRNDSDLIAFAMGFVDDARKGLGLKSLNSITSRVRVILHCPIYRDKLQFLVRSPPGNSIFANALTRNRYLRLTITRNRISVVIPLQRTTRSRTETTRLHKNLRTSDVEKRCLNTTTWPLRAVSRTEFRDKRNASGSLSPSRFETWSLRMRQMDRISRGATYNGTTKDLMHASACHRGVAAPCARGKARL